MAPRFAAPRIVFASGADALRLASLALLCALAPAQAVAAQVSADGRSVPAEYVRGLSLPGTLDQFRRPAAIAVDDRSGEILVADASNNRIVIFDANGVYRFEFGGRDDFATPLDVAVDSDGFVYVLGATRNGRTIQRYDFDGTSPTAFVTPLDTTAGTDIANFCIDDEDRLLLLDASRGAVIVLSRDGEQLHSFTLEEGAEDRNEIYFGSIHAERERVYVPVSTHGTVRVHSIDGTLLRSIGFKGNNVGELNFPVAVTVGEGGMVMVLDKHRFNVLCFSPEGRFLGEFGGKGRRPGWFYHPTLLAVDVNGWVYIGQIYGHRIDVCRIPEFIEEALSRSAKRQPAFPPDESASTAGTPDPEPNRGRLQIPQ